MCGTQHFFSFPLNQDNSDLLKHKVLAAFMTSNLSGPKIVMHLEIGSGCISKPRSLMEL